MHVRKEGEGFQMYIAENEEEVRTQNSERKKVL